MSYVDISQARIREVAPGEWVAFGMYGIIANVTGRQTKIAEILDGEFEEISVDDAISELTRRGEMTGHEAIAARRRATGAAA